MKKGPNKYNFKLKKFEVFLIGGILTKLCLFMLLSLIMETLFMNEINLFSLSQKWKTQ